MRQGLLFCTAVFSLYSLPALAAGPGISGGVDLRASNSTKDGANAEVNALYLNFRQVWADAEGDRWIGVAQVDVEHNFSDVQPYQIYLQYKGPLGKWNVQAGHFLLPFGLLATYDTERLLLGGLENLNLGIRHDSGAEFFGRVDDFDYALAVTDGLGVETFVNSHANPVVTGRVAYVRDDWQLGLSALLGKITFNKEHDSESDNGQVRRTALDFTRSWGPATLRAETSVGTENAKGVWGGLLLADYALTDRLELNTRAAFWHREGDRSFAGAGLSYRLAEGMVVRVADEQEFGKNENNTVTAQFSYEFAR